MKRLATILLVAALIAAMIQPVVAAQTGAEQEAPAAWVRLDALPDGIDPADHPNISAVYRDELSGKILVVERSGMEGVIAPYWTELATIYHGVTFSGTTANVTSTATAYNTSHKVAVTSTLQQASGSTYITNDSWSGSGTWTCTVNNSKTVSSGTYRVKTVVKVSSSDGALLETVTEYSASKTC